ncbi:MAG: PSD1 and planctomycete cytochrome C domain-containing protein [Planctomycetota bacterium]
MLLRQIALAIGSCIWLFAATSKADDVTDGEMLFVLKVRTIFQDKCMACHGEDTEWLDGNFDLRGRDSLMRGGDSFGDEVLVPGDSAASMLYRAVARTEVDYEMPPKESEALTEQESWWIRDWIDAGAPWPSDDRIAEIEDEYASGIIVQTSGGLNDSWTNRRYESEKLWAYRGIERVDVPADVHPVDWFIDRRLQELELDAAPPADAVTMLRRLSFGLTGLPPSLESLRQFTTRYVVDPQAAVVEFADNLMATPQYGEQFARHWLDVTRYADTAGFANDYTRPNAWRYRDYVIRAFNDDKPFNDFVRQQIAGDEMDPTDPENVIATGFLRMGPWEQTSMSVFQVTRQQWLDDVTDSVGQTFLAHPLQCAKCHDHKFDPIPTRDYYGMMAVFSTTQFAEPAVPFLDEENRTGFAESQKWTQAKIDAYQQQKRELNRRVAAARKAEKGDVQVGDNGLSPGDEASLGRMQKNIKRHQWELDKTKPIALAVYTGKTVQRTNVQSRLLLPERPFEKGFLQDDVIYDGGDVFSPGSPVTPGAISAVVSLSDVNTAEFNANPKQRRLQLANWIVDPRNPLTSRVIVNRVWSWHFGRGIAGNPNNFGGTGAVPTHPLLLDFLADWFVENDWSIKRLNQLIVSSEMYRRSSSHPDAKTLDAIDPDRKWYAALRPRRLDAEELRDAMLACSGELSDQVGGIPSRPEINQEVAFQPRQIMGGTASVYEPDPLPSQRNRRSIYAEKIRGLRDPFFETFNQPGPDNSCELRETSTVAPQALTLLNADEVHDRSIALANRLIEEFQDDDHAIVTAAFETVLQRAPSDVEHSAVTQRWKSATDDESGKIYPKPEYPTEMTRTVMAEKTGEPYDFVEVMPAFVDFVADLQRRDVDARTRGLAHVCLVLLNCNEFAFID